MLILRFVVASVDKPHTAKYRVTQAGPKTYSGIVDSFQNFKVSIGVKVRADH